MLYAVLILSLVANVATALAWRRERRRWRWEQRAAEALAHKVATGAGRARGAQRFADGA